MTKNLYIYIDESGVFHKGLDSTFFVYSGYMFFGTEEKNIAERKYNIAEKQVKKGMNILPNVELKASMKIKTSHRKKLINSLKGYTNFSILIDKTKLKDRSWKININDSNNFKRYALRRGIEYVLDEIYPLNKEFLDNITVINLAIDNDNLKSITKLNLDDYIYKHIKVGSWYISKFDGLPVSSSEPKCPLLNKVNIKMEDSKQNVLIRASDVLANIKFKIHNKNHINKTFTQNNICLRLVK